MIKKGNVRITITLDEETFKLIKENAQHDRRTFSAEIATICNAVFAKQKKAIKHIKDNTNPREVLKQEETSKENETSWTQEDEEDFNKLIEEYKGKHENDNNNNNH